MEPGHAAAYARPLDTGYMPPTASTKNHVTGAMQLGNTPSRPTHAAQMHMQQQTLLLVGGCQP
jgi:hypothetical protein